MAEVWYATREQVKAATDIKETARNNPQIARAIASATDSVEDLLDRVFYPELATRLFDFPVHADPEDGSRTIPLGRDELVAVAELTVEGVTIDPALYTLLPANGTLPYTAVELDATVALAGTVRRRAVAITGRYAYWDAEDPSGALVAGVDDTTTKTVTVSDSAAVGVGSLLLVDAERMLVEEQSMVDTGQNTAGALTEMNNDVLLPVGSAASFVKGEVVMVDAEKLLVVEIAGNNLVVKRAWDGSAIAAHASGVDVYAPRRLTVRRGVLGTTAATHASGATVSTHRIPAQVNALAIAEALLVIAQENTAYGRTVGSGESERPAPGAGIEDLRTRARAAYGRGTWRKDT